MYQNKALYNFCKWGQHLIVNHNKGQEYALYYLVKFSRKTFVVFGSNYFLEKYYFIVLFLVNSKAGLNPSTFVYSRFSLKIQFLYCLLSSLFLWGAPMEGREWMSLDSGKSICNTLPNCRSIACALLRNMIFFSVNFMVCC